MNMPSFLKKKLKSLLVVIAILAVVIVAIRIVSPTKIALINFPEYMYVKMAKSNNSYFIKVENFKPEELSNLTNYDMVMVFGMGMNMPEQQEPILQKAIDKGVPVFVFAGGNSKFQTTNIDPEHLDIISDYFENAGTANFKNMLQYIRKEIDGKKLFATDYKPAKKYAADVLFYIEEEAIFNTIPQFESYCLKNGFHKKGQKNIVLFTSVPGPFNANRDHLNAIIGELQSRAYNVYPVSTFSNRLPFLQKIAPSLIVYMPHGRFGMGSDAEPIEQELKKLNVPIVCPVSVLKRYEEWVKDKQGMSGGFLSQSVTMPEFDGGILPYAVVAQYEDENGLLIFKAVPERLKGFGKTVDNYIALKTKANKDKKLAVIFYKGHGKGAGEAAGLEVMPSIYMMLKRLQAEGYNVGALPATAKEFEKDLIAKAPLLGPYAEGAFDSYLKTGYAQLVKKEQYEQWCKQVMPDTLYQQVVDKYGQAPGSYMALSNNKGDFLAIACAQYGNIAIMPQPMPGLGTDGFKLVHGAKTPPPHSYLAPYLWIQKAFKADAIMHFGTHGSLEFTPGKQVALSNYDWADILIGTTPHLYPYVINDPGEAAIAKRRSYGVTISHITPPFIESMVLSNKKIIRDKIEKYENASGNLKIEYSKSAKEIAVKEGYAKDLGLDTKLDKPYSEDEMLRLINYLDEMDNERITAGLYTMGIPYQERLVASTVLLMSSNEIAYAQMELDKQKGKLTRKQTENKNFFTKNYLIPAKARIAKVYQSGGTQTAFLQTISQTDFSRAERWVNSAEMPKKGMHHGKMDGKTGATVSSAKLEELIVKIAADPKQKAFVARLKSEKEFERAISLLDPQKRASAKRIAIMIPAMKEAIEVAEDKNIQTLLPLLKDKKVKEQALKMLDDPSLTKKVKEQETIRNKMLLAMAESDSVNLVLSTSVSALKQLDVYSLKKMEQNLEFFQQKQKELQSILPKDNKLYALISEKSLNTIAERFNKVLSDKSEKEAVFSDAVFAVKKAFDNIALYRKHLSSTPQSEFDAIVNALNGGFTPPTPGGDPLNNPAILPTGRNIYSINAEQTPTKEAWKVGQKLADQMLADFKKKNNKYPLKVSYTIWSSEFIESEGATVAQILYLLGVEPIWDAFGRVRDVRLIPSKDLGRPRIDVVVQTSGQLRDIAASRLYLIQKAIGMAASDESKETNFVKEGVLAAKKRLLEKGFSPKEAEELSKTRVFGGINGMAGAGNFQKLVEKSDSWENQSQLAKTYINNMGASYGDENNWGDFKEGVLEAALLNTEAVVQPRQSNTWGPLSLDHMYEFMGGINTAVKEVTGKDPESYLSDYRNPSNPRIQGLKEGIWSEARTTLLNPRYIKEYMNGGASSAETFAETFRNTFGWNATKASVIEDRLWDELYDTYVKDKQQLGVHKFFETENPYALQEMTAVMLETVRKGYWKASKEQVIEMVSLHAKLVKEHDAACSGFVCDNPKLRKMIAEKLSPEEAKNYNEKLEEALSETNTEKKKGKILKKEEKDKLENKQENKANSNKNNSWIAIILGLVVIIAAIVALRIKNRNKK